MKIFKTMTAFENDPSGAVYQVDTIEHAGKMWLVPHWIENPAEQWRAPVRIICLETLAHQKTPGSPYGDFVLNAPISRAVFEGRAPPPAGSFYTVIEAPPIRLRVRRDLQ